MLPLPRMWRHTDYASATLHSSRLYHRRDYHYAVWVIHVVLPFARVCAQGTFQSLTSAGFGLGALVGGWVGAHAGWQGMFAVASVTVLGMWLSILTARGLISLLKHTTPPLAPHGSSKVLQ